MIRKKNHDIHLYNINPDQHVEWIIRWESLKEPILRIEPHDSVVVQIFWKGELVDLDGALVQNESS